MHAGWIDITFSQISSDSSLILVKLVGADEQAVSIQFTPTVHADNSWTVTDCTGKAISQASSLLASLPRTLYSVKDVLIVIDFVNKLSPCPGNNDRKFLPLVEHRKGPFIDSSGIIIDMHSQCL